MMKLGLLATTPSAPKRNPELISIPLLGLANCGPATIIAEAQPEGHLQVSNKLIGTSYDPTSVFAVQAVGNSMNRANINGNTIEDGDYVIVDGSNKDFKNGDYVLSLIGNLANIKRFTKDDLNRQIILISESSENFTPIYIHEDDFRDYMSNGKVLAVLKKPKKSEGEVTFDYEVEH